MVQGHAKAMFNPLNTKFYSICHLLALLGAHHILHVSRIMVKKMGTSEFSACTGWIASFRKTSECS